MTRAEGTPEPEVVGGPIRVLYVEDDQKLAQLTRRYLENHGLVVVWVGNGEDALGTAAREHFDLALLDIMLPRMDGITLCRALRTRTDLPVIMLTAVGAVPKIVCQRTAVPLSVVPVKLGSANCVPEVAPPGNASLLKLKPTSPEESASGGVVF